MNYEEIIKLLDQNKNLDKASFMKRFGIGGKNVLGIPLPFLRNLAKQIESDHNLALNLWKSGFHEARILASMIDNPKLVTEQQLESWVREFDSWDLRILDKAEDSRNFVKKAISWALRQIGNKNFNLKQKAMETAEVMLTNPSKSAQWIAKYSIKVLENKEISF